MKRVARVTIGYIEKWLLDNDKSFHLYPGQRIDNTKMKIKWECNLGHQWESIWGNIQQGSGCPHCNGNAKINILYIDKWLLDNNKPFYLIEGQIIKNARTKLKWGCNEGHLWETPWDGIQNGQGCPHCYGNSKKTIEEIEEWLIVNNTPFHLIPDQTREGQNTKLEWECVNHHRWRACWDNIRQGQGCPHCHNKTEGIISKMLTPLFKEINTHYYIKCPKDINRSGKAFIDFFIPSINTIVEYNGRQHYEYIPHFHRKGVSVFYHQQHRDQWLRDYCKEEGVNLIEIPYWEKDLEKFLLEKLKIFLD